MVIVASSESVIDVGKRFAEKRFGFLGWCRVGSVSGDDWLQTADDKPKYVRGSISSDSAILDLERKAKDYTYVNYLTAEI